MSDVIIVTGTGQIGQAIARRVSSGKHVLLADLHKASADAAAEILANAGFDVSTATVDVSSRESVHALAQTAVALGDITGVIHAAGVSPSQARPEVILAVDLYGTHWCSKSSGRSSRPAAPVWSSRRSLVTDLAH
jgi:NAD(P)-dependent dehydrogenase (short-subunit alcohol dehydrogenase family)